MNIEMVPFIHSVARSFGFFWMTTGFLYWTEDAKLSPWMRVPFAALCISGAYLALRGNG